MNPNKIILIAIVVLLVLTHHQSQAGPIDSAICSAGCVTLAGVCCAAAGYVFGFVADGLGFVFTAGAGTPAFLLACNAAFRKCMAICAVV